jgi:ATP phosphoribosyltransferase
VLSPIRIGIPSKGRLKSTIEKFFSSRGLNIIKNNKDREYLLKFQNREDLQPILLTASDIPQEISKGNIDLGITGKDLMYEKIIDWKERIVEFSELNFGSADLVIAVPQFWVDVNSLDDLDDIAHFYRHKFTKRLKVATKYQNLTRDFFVSREIADYEIIDSQGATEGAVKNGLADIIVDITSTGETLKQNNLKVLSDGLILKSEATLFGNKNYLRNYKSCKVLEDFLVSVGTKQLFSSMLKNT